MKMPSTVVAVCTSAGKGTPKKDVRTAILRAGHGIVGDAHAGPGIRQISLFAQESYPLNPSGDPVFPWGSFGENITTRGILVADVPVGTKLAIGSVTVQVTQIGKECHSSCAIGQLTGDCRMPREGVFAVVISSGEITVGDRIVVLAPALHVIVK